MQKRVLYIASIDKHILRFHIPSLEWWHNNGYEISVACKGNSNIPFCKKTHNIDFERSPFKLGHIKAYFQLRKLLSKEKFDIIHCHTAVASVITRLAAQKYRTLYQTKVIYTAHGFHFFKGSPLSYWLLYYPLERFFSRFLDCLITINEEDYKLAQTKFFCPDVRRISGMGVDSKRFKRISSEEKIRSRGELNLNESDKVIIYVAEFIHRKNHEFLITSLKAIIKIIPQIKLILPGRGLLFDEMKCLVNQLKLNDYVIFVGFRDDIHKVLGAADIGVSSSRQEGLGLHLIEALMCGLPVIASQDRGHKEIIHHGENGFLYSKGSVPEFIKYLNLLFDNNDLYNQMSDIGPASVQRFELKYSIMELESIFIDYMD